MQNIFGEKIIYKKIVPSIPYQGNKRKLAGKILQAIYDKVGDFDDFYDLFGGGGAISVCALLSGFNTHYNELNTGVYELLKYIISGGEIPKNWVSREDFNKLKDGNDWYAGLVKTCWSFGNNQRGYLFGKDVEELKRVAHEYLMQNGYNGTTDTRTQLVKQFKSDKDIIKRFELEQLERLQQLELSNLSYNEVEIKPNSVIYCDPPYINTSKYAVDFDHEPFYKWALESKHPVFISEYTMPNSFIKVASFEHRSTLSAKANNKTIENLYWNGVSL